MSPPHGTPPRVDIYTLANKLLTFRCALLITTLLVLVNIFNSVVATTPSDADGLTALAFWIVACIIFTFASLLSYVFILIKMKIPKKITEEHAAKKQFLQDPEKNKFLHKRPNLDLDIALLLLNMTIFLLFVIIYWANI